MADKPLDQALFDAPYAFEFFQAVRLLEKLYPERDTVGRDALPASEVARFRSYVSFDFPSSEIQQLDRSADDGTGGERVEMLVNFMGMVGASGVLPSHYTELVLDRIRHRDKAMWAFLDIFTHRAVSMFYQAWGKYRFPIGYERGNDEFTQYLFDFAGLGTKGLRGRMSVPDESLLPYAGLIAQKPHSSNALENVLSDYFGFDAKIEQFFGQWLMLEPPDRTYLGDANNVLGVSTIAGTAVWSQQTKFRIALGPLGFSQFQALLPNGAANPVLDSIVRFMMGSDLDFDVKLFLSAGQVPGTVLTTRAVRRPMLGWTSYLKTRSFGTDDDQVVLQFAGDASLN
ncbi:MAG TPA: type VI secretion system baseplate subunit TssG [Pyrinomonadaceae bacterium]|nr:type VI secretion system baseplate subunit TssG [Pyrinomonadaceae bacterium]